MKKCPCCNKAPLQGQQIVCSACYAEALIKNANVRKNSPMFFLLRNYNTAKTTNAQTLCDECEFKAMAWGYQFTYDESMKKYIVLKIRSV